MNELELIKQLRIGNHVIWENEDCEQECIQVTEEIFLSILSEDKKYRNRIYSIPLTEEWMDKFDFTNVGMVCRMDIDSHYELCWFKHGEMRLQTVGSGFTMILKHVNHVHTLQNFWKIYTGKELEILSQHNQDLLKGLNTLPEE